MLNLQASINTSHASHIISKKSPNKLLNNIYKNRYIYIMLLPVITFYIIFRYIPMYGVIIAFMILKLAVVY